MADEPHVHRRDNLRRGYFGYKTTVVHDACATRELEFDGKSVPAEQVHTALMSTLAFGYAEVISADTYLAK
ncbi:hypothetical protein GCM10011394_26650 [Luteimonas terricola]|uniref:Uncharacterized protein n=1 Tax=Luteimonas terricola TaxID=645597 RepID=A0ABQ2EQ84_9GAMM|nr:hypothetical protein GCM10011394_26650 [Luteimonas terricola]